MDENNEEGSVRGAEGSVRGAWLSQASKGWKSMTVCAEKGSVATYLDRSDAKKHLLPSASFRDGHNEGLPLPAKFGSWKSMAAVPRITGCCRGLIASLVKPHRILAASVEFLNTIKATSDEVCGRNLDAIFSPNTDSAAVRSAMNNAALLRTTQVKLALLSSDGLEVEATVSFSPYRGCADGRLEGFLLQIECIHNRADDSSEPVFLVEDFGPYASRETEDRMVLRLLRREANQTAGQENEQERQRQQGARRR
jgi:hypothetical protein